jgi:hypothetical protein
VRVKSIHYREEPRTPKEQSKKIEDNIDIDNLTEDDIEKL